ncbi:MAG: UPF0280 family protein [Deltaproteobacteria bacterium]|nr:UPF0280 family protein [Deltaproteobacteria bacterium]
MKRNGTYQERNYRNQVHGGRMPAAFRVVVKETDLFVRAEANLADITRELVLQHRGYLEAYIRQHRLFSTTLSPWTVQGPAPGIVREMARAGQAAGVGPMAAVAGAIAEHVGRDLLSHTSEVIVENGGDLFIKASQPVTVGIFANQSPLSLRTGLRIEAGSNPVAVCTSSGTVGHSLSLGRADAVCVVSSSCSLADAVATSVGNRIQKAGDIGAGIEIGSNIKGVEGLVVIVADKIGMWGNIEIVPLQEKKG